MTIIRPRTTLPNKSQHRIRKTFDIIHWDLRKRIVRSGDNSLVYSRWIYIYKTKGHPDYCGGTDPFPSLDWMWRKHVYSPWSSGWSEWLCKYRLLRDWVRQSNRDSLTPSSQTRGNPGLLRPLSITSWSTEWNFHKKSE